MRLYESECWEEQKGIYLGYECYALTDYVFDGDRARQRMIIEKMMDNDK